MKRGQKSCINALKQNNLEAKQPIGIFDGLHVAFFNHILNKTKMKFIPILFSTPMVQAILDGRKTQTRRVIKSRHESGLFQICRRKTDGQITSINSLDWDGRNCEKDIVCPYGQPGDILWVREKSCYVHLEHAHDLLEGFREKRQTIFGTDMHEDWMKYAKEKYGYKWTPSLFMAKHHCRIFLKITNVRVEGLQSISEDAAESEGVEKKFSTLFNECRFKDYHNVKDDYRCAVSSFQSLWASINGVESWDANPWVWVIEFERTELTEEQKAFFNQ